MSQRLSAIPQHPTHPEAISLCAWESPASLACSSHRARHHPTPLTRCESAAIVGHFPVALDMIAQETGLHKSAAKQSGVQVLNVDSDHVRRCWHVKGKKKHTQKCLNVLGIHAAKCLDTSSALCSLYTWDVDAHSNLWHSCEATDSAL